MAQIAQPPMINIMPVTEKISLPPAATQTTVSSIPATPAMAPVPTITATVPPVETRPQAYNVGAGGGMCGRTSHANFATSTGDAPWACALVYGASQPAKSNSAYSRSIGGKYCGWQSAYGNNQSAYGNNQ